MNTTPARGPQGAGRRFAPALALGTLYLCLGAATRVVLWLKFGAAADVPAADLPLLMLAGLLNDAVEALYIVTPLVLYLLLVPDRWYRTLASRALLAGGFVLTLSALIYTAAAEFYFFEEFDARFNLVAFDYLRYPAGCSSTSGRPIRSSRRCSSPSSWREPSRGLCATGCSQGQTLPPRCAGAWDRSQCTWPC